MRLIDADKLERHEADTYGAIEDVVYAEDIDAAPTIDAEPVWIVHRKDGIYDVYKGNRDNWVIARLSADNIFAWLAEQNMVDIRFVDESIPNCGAEMNLKD